MTPRSNGARLSHLAPLVAISLLGAACSSSGSDDPAPSAELRGRYALTSASGQGTYSSIWFSADRYEAVLRTCGQSCEERGTYRYDGTTLSLVSADSGVRSLTMRPDAAASASTADGAPRSVRARAGGAVAPLTANAELAVPGSEEDACAIDALDPPPASPSADASTDPNRGSLLAGQPVCLLSGLITYARGTDTDGSLFVAQRVGASKVSRDTSNAERSKAYNCASAALSTVGGAAGALVCGFTALPTGGLTLVCYLVGAVATAAGALAYCGGECPGYETLCPGYQPADFVETSTLRSRCVGNVRYSHWETADGQSQAEFESGTCQCRQSCPER